MGWHGLAGQDAASLPTLAIPVRPCMSMAPIHPSHESFISNLISGSPTPWPSWRTWKSGRLTRSVPRQRLGIGVSVLLFCPCRPWRCLNMCSTHIFDISLCTHGRPLLFLYFLFSRKTHYPRAPKNVQRHVLLLELREALGLLPTDVTRQTIMAYDPLPPDNAPCVVSL